MLVNKLIKTITKFYKLSDVKVFFYTSPTENIKSANFYSFYPLDVYSKIVEVGNMLKTKRKTIDLNETSSTYCSSLFAFKTVNEPILIGDYRLTHLFT